MDCDVVSVGSHYALSFPGRSVHRDPAGSDRVGQASQRDRVGWRRAERQAAADTTDSPAAGSSADNGPHPLPAIQSPVPVARSQPGRMFIEAEIGLSLCVPCPVTCVL